MKHDSAAIRWVGSLEIYCSFDLSIQMGLIWVEKAKLILKLKDYQEWSHLSRNIEEKRSERQTRAHSQRWICFETHDPAFHSTQITLRLWNVNIDSSLGQTDLINQTSKILGSPSSGLRNIIV